LSLEEEAQEHSRIKLAHLMLCVLADMYQKLVLILPPNKIFQDGLCQKLADLIMKQRSQIVIKLMTPDLPLGNNLTPKIDQLAKLISAQLAERSLKD